jgi:hypothetical protein
MNRVPSAERFLRAVDGRMLVLVGDDLEMRFSGWTGPFGAPRQFGLDFSRNGDRALHISADKISIRHGYAEQSAVSQLLRIAARGDRRFPFEPRVDDESRSIRVNGRQRRFRLLTSGDAGVMWIEDKGVWIQISGRADLLRSLGLRTMRVDELEALLKSLRARYKHQEADSSR